MNSVAASLRAGDVGADEVASHDVSARVLKTNSNPAETIDGQALYGAAACSDMQTILISGADIASIQFDLQNRVIAIGQRIEARPWLRVAVDRDGTGNRRQRRERLDCERLNREY